MRKIILTYGLIAGIIVATMMVVSLSLMRANLMGMDKGMIVGYASMVIALSVIFFAVRTYRDEYCGGIMTFWKACQIGLLVTLVAGIIYGVTWEVYYGFRGEEFNQAYSQSVLENVRNNGATEAEMQAAEEKLRRELELYQNPIIRFGFTLMEILPVGILVTLICAALLRKRQVSAA